MDAVRAGRKVSRVVRGGFWRFAIRMGGGNCGPRLEVETGCTLRWGPHAGVMIGAGVRLGRGVILDVPRGAQLIIGDGAKLMHYTVVAASERVEIGKGTQVGESSSIRDADHVPGGGEGALGDSLVATPTMIGSDVWLGRGVAVLRGSFIGDGALVGANSVVVAKYPVPAGSRAVGAPARHLRT